MKTLAPHSKTASTVLIIIGVVIVLISGASYLKARLAAERLYDQAVQAQQQGDLEQARSKLSDVIQINPSYKDAKARFSQVKKDIAINDDPELAAVYEQDAEKQAAQSERIPRPKKIKPTEAEKGIGSGRLKLPYSSGAKTIFNSATVEGYKMVSSNATKTSTERVYEAVDQSLKIQHLTVKTAGYEDRQQLSDALYSMRYKYPRNNQNIWVRGNMAYYGNNGKDVSVLAWIQGDELYSLEGKIASGAPGSALSPLMDMVP